MERWYTTGEVAARLKINQSTVIRWVDKLHLGQRFGRARHLNEEDISTLRQAGPFVKTLAGRNPPKPRQKKSSK